MRPHFRVSLLEEAPNMRCHIVPLWCTLVCASALAAGQPTVAEQDASRRISAVGAPALKERKPLTHDEPVYVVVHTAVDCPICKVWRESDSGLALARKLSESWPHMNLVVIDRHSLSGSEAESLYPPELRFLYEDRSARYQLSPPTPLFEIVARNRVVLRLPGLQAWTEQVVPALRELERTRETSPSR